MTTAIIIEAIRGAAAIAEMLYGYLKSAPEAATIHDVQAELRALEASMSRLKQQADADWAKVGGPPK